MAPRPTAFLDRIAHMSDLITRLAGQPMRGVGAEGLPQGVLLLHAASDLFVALAFLAVPALLIAHGRRQDRALRRVFTLLALFVACAGLTHVLRLASAVPGSWAGAAVVFGAAVLAWGASLALLRTLPRALGAVEHDARAVELERLRLLEAAVAASGDGVIIAAPVSPEIPAPRIVYANPAFGQLTGYHPKEAVGQSPTILPEADALDGVRAALRATSPSRLELPSRRKDGTRVWAEWHIVPVQKLDGRSTHWVAVLRDTTDRRQAQEELRAARDFLTSVLDNIPVPVAVRDRDDRYQLVNPAWEKCVRIPRARAIGKRPADLLPPEVAATTGRQTDAVRSAGKPVREELAADFGRGRRVLLGVAFPIPGADGRVAAVGEVSVDLTDQKRAEDAVKELNAELKRRVQEAEALVELSPVGIAVVNDPSGQAVEVNQALRQLLGLPPETDPELTPAAMRLRVRFRRGGREVPHRELPIQRCLACGEAIDGAEFEITRPDGEERVVVNSVRALFDDSGRVRGCVSVYTDITERVRMVRALQESEERFRRVFEDSPIGLYRAAPDGRVLLVNPAALRMAGCCSAEEFPRRDSALREADGAHASECAWQRRDGATVFLREHTRAARGPAGEVLYFEGTLEDVTERRRLEEQFRQAQKMEAVGCLAGGIAHDFNNLLTVILGNAGLLSHHPPRVADQLGLIDDLCGAAERAAVLVRQLLTFSRRQPARPEVVDLKEVVAGLAGMLRRLLGERVAVTTSLPPSPVRVRADRGQLEQVVMNLAVNARDAMPGGGTLALAATRADGADGPIARLVVSDTGCGMTDEVKARIFEPFFTTKGPDKGTGLGLATVFGIVQQAGGRIEIDTAPGRGSTFRVDLPWCADTPSPSTVFAMKDVLSRQPPGRGRSVLLVEDEDGVRKFARAAMETHGYAVTEAPDAEAALGLLGSSGPIEVLVTDLTMPGMDGAELAERVKVLHPDVGVVFTSGYVPDDSRLAGVPDAVFLPKPFSPVDLLRAAGKAVARSSAAHAPSVTG